MKEADGAPKFTVEISGEILALTIMFGGTAPEDRMFVYDWKTGRNKTVSIFYVSYLTISHTGCVISRMGSP
jgi:hypothetical protein